MDDVIVVGGGPAGNNLALRLATLGYGVTVIDWRQHLGDKLCTGIVGRECVQRFPLDNSLIYRNVKEATAIAPGGQVMDIARRDTQAHVVDRVAYVASFAEKARQAGARYLLGFRVTDISSNGEYASVTYTDEMERSTLKARALVLASGFGGDLTGQLGLGKVGDYVTGIQAEVLAPDLEQVHIYFGQKIAPGFFAWLVPTTGGKALVGLLCRKNGQIHLDELMVKLQMEGKITTVTKEPARWGVPLRPLGKTFGDRLLVVGDAAGQVKPTTGGGIYYAFLASDIAADALHTALRVGDLSAARLSVYEKEWKALLTRELEIGNSVRRFFEVAKDRQIDFLMHTIASNGIYKDLVNSKSLSFDWHSRAVLKLMGHPVISKALSFISPALGMLAPRT